MSGWRGRGRCAPAGRNPASRRGSRLRPTMAACAAPADRRPRSASAMVRHRRLRPAGAPLRSTRPTFCCCRCARCAGTPRPAGVLAQPLRPAGASTTRPRRRPRRRAGLAGRTAAGRGHHRRLRARSGCTPTRACWATASSRSASGTATAPTAAWRPSWPRSTTPSASATATCSTGPHLRPGAARAQGLPRVAVLPVEGGYRFRFMRTACRRRTARGPHRPRRRRGPAAAHQRQRPPAAADRRQRAAALLWRMPLMTWA
jgi:hypothetical protein